MSLITSGPEFVEQLNVMLRDNNIDWRDFEKLRRGEITISGMKFYLRVGLHLGLPRKAIIASIQFIRFKPFTDCGVTKELDPKYPDDNLFYSGNSAHSAYWHPWCTDKPEQKQDWAILDNAVLYNNLDRLRRRA